MKFCPRRSNVSKKVIKPWVPHIKIKLGLPGKNKKVSVMKEGVMKQIILASDWLIFHWNVELSLVRNIF